MTKPPDWQETLDDLDRRRQHTLGDGRTERLAKHRGKGKLDARARIDRLARPGDIPRNRHAGRRRDRRRRRSSSAPA